MDQIIRKTLFFAIALAAYGNLSLGKCEIRTWKIEVQSENTEKLPYLNDGSVYFESRLSEDSLNIKIERAAKFYFKSSSNDYSQIDAIYNVQWVPFNKGKIVKYEIPMQKELWKERASIRHITVTVDDTLYSLNWRDKNLFHCP
jgi:hypothetical protein